MKYDIHAEKGWVNRGNLYRMKQLMRRAEQGDRMTLAFLGGSITQGSLSSRYTNCYAYLVYDWFVRKFPKTAFTYINAGVGGTTSQFGVARADEDVLSFKPDFVIIEFSVNDDNNDFFKETYEGLVRRIYGNGYEPAVLLVHNICYDTGVSAEEKHREIGFYYELPSVSMKETIYSEVASGAIQNRQITPDDLHPNTEGHALVAEVVTAFLERVYEQMEEDEQPFVMPEPLTANAYGCVKRYQNDNCVPACDGFTVDKTLKKYVNDMFRGGWTASGKNASITFYVEGTELAVQYRKSVKLPAPIAVAVVDDDEEHAVELDANFDETWGDCLYIATLAYHIKNGLHKVEIKLKETHENDAVPFYLVSVIGAAAEQKKPILFFEPILKQTVWGGRRLGEQWGYQIPGENAGECWGISANPHGDCRVREGIYQGRTLSALWKEEPQLFGNPRGDRFPLLTKLIDSKDDLSIQVHPDDAYAKENENGSLGKTECWYVLDCPENAALVVGHNAASKEELCRMIEEKRWSDFIREVPIKKGDFIQIEPGTVHAIKGGVLLLETQQNSDITYRVYDYDRKPPRQLHVKQSLDVITVPAKEIENSILDTNGLSDNTMNRLISCDYYQVWKLRVTRPYALPAQQSYLLFSVVEGEGTIDGKKIRKGDHFLLPADYGEASLEGAMEFILSAPGEKC